MFGSNMADCAVAFANFITAIESCGPQAALEASATTIAALFMTMIASDRVMATKTYEALGALLTRDMPDSVPAFATVQ